MQICTKHSNITIFLIVHPRNESAQYKNELRQCRLQKARIEEQCNNAELDVARWRFEALRSRCIIIGREQLLEERGIAFDTADTDAAAGDTYGQKARELARQQPPPRPQLMQSQAVRSRTEQVKRTQQEISEQVADDQSMMTTATVQQQQVVQSVERDFRVADDSAVVESSESVEPQRYFNSLADEMGRQIISTETEMPLYNDENLPPPMSQTPASIPVSPRLNLVSSPARLKLDTIRRANQLAQSKSVNFEPAAAAITTPKPTAQFGAIRARPFDEIGSKAAAADGIQSASGKSPSVLFGALVPSKPSDPPAAESGDSSGGYKTVKIRHIIVKSKKPTLY